MPMGCGSPRRPLLRDDFPPVYRAAVHEIPTTDLWTASDERHDSSIEDEQVRRGALDELTGHPTRQGGDNARLDRSEHDKRRVESGGAIRMHVARCPW